MRYYDKISFLLGEEKPRNKKMYEIIENDRSKKRYSKKKYCEDVIHIKPCQYSQIAKNQNEKLLKKLEKRIISLATKYVVIRYTDNGYSIVKTFDKRQEAINYLYVMIQIDSTGYAVLKAVENENGNLYFDLTKDECLFMSERLKIFRLSLGLSLPTNYKTINELQENEDEENEKEEIATVSSV